MADINRVVLVGRLTKDSELKYTAQGQPVLHFSIAVNRRVKQGDEYKDEASYFDIVYWGRQGQNLAQYLVKGKAVGIDGELRQERWQQDGQFRSKVNVVATNVQLLTPRTDNDKPPANKPGKPSATQPGLDDFGADDGFTDDVPF